MFEAVIRDIEFAPGKTITLETGRLAKQADGAVVVRMGDTMVLCTAVVSEEVKAGKGFFPLSVEYREKYSAGGKIPGGFIKREGRQNEKEVLSSRLVDRAIRPLFPEGFFNEVQIITYVISADEHFDADVLAGVGASAALLVGGAPFDGPIAEVRIGRINGEFVVNPTMSELDESDINLVVAGKEDAIMMVEGELDEVGEDEIVDALEIAHEAIRALCQGQVALAEAFEKETPTQYVYLTLPDALVDQIEEMVAGRIAAHVRKPYDKRTFYSGITDIKEETLTALLGKDDAETGEYRADATEEGYTAEQISEAVSVVERQVIREMILDENRRLDGRGLRDVRPIWGEVGYLPRVHGSAIFTRGETQVLASVTLGTGKDVQAVDQIFDTNDKKFFLHYNFPPFCTGETKMIRGASRREIGHGILAERALMGMLPDSAAFPYTIRINADVLESNGSSSMASVCSGSMALMDAAVPMKKAVAGVAMGLVTDGERVAVLTDILGIEDHLGDMDFKLTGTRDGVTACQMDIKVKGITSDVLRNALEQAREARHHILDKMEETISAPKDELSPFAPRLTQITIDAEFIGAVIGPGGKIIQGIQRDTNTSVEIEERDGLGHITVAATNGEDARAAVALIQAIVAVPEPGEEYEGTVKNIQSFGAIVEILPGKEGLLHISELDHGYVESVDDYLQVGDKVKVQLIEIRDDGKLRLSRKPFLPKPEGVPEQREYNRGDRSRSSGGHGGQRSGRRGGGSRGRGGRRDGNRR